ncbi:MAG: hypothetical protein V1866_00755 [archaeon]
MTMNGLLFGKMSESLGRKAFLIFISLLIFFLVVRIPSAVSWGPGPNYRNYSVHATVNVTNAYPEVINITCNNGSTVVLNGGTTKAVSCLVQTRDFNGGNTIFYVNATFYYYLNYSSDPDDNNTHYTTGNCSVNGSYSGYYQNWTCVFDVWYYANNGSWRVNATAWDDYNTSGFNANNASIGALLALNVTEVIDYGTLSVDDTSNSTQANVTNFGNLPINVTVYGFGGDNATTGTGIAMRCEQRNLSISNERYSGSDVGYDSMISITGTAAMVPGVSIAKQIDPAVLMVNSTYWRLHINITDNPFGICNGTVVFSATGA